MGIIVCAETLDAAWKGRNALKVQWDKGTHPQMDNDFIEKTFMEDLDKPGSAAAKVGDAQKALGEAQKKVEATYFVPFVAHTTMEPMNCTAHVQKDRCDVWVPTQAQLVSRMLAAQFAELPPGEGPDPYHSGWLRARQTRCSGFCNRSGRGFKGRWKAGEARLDERRGHQV